MPLGRVICPSWTQWTQLALQMLVGSKNTRRGGKSQWVSRFTVALMYFSRCVCLPSSRAMRLSLFSMDGLFYCSYR